MKIYAPINLIAITLMVIIGILTIIVIVIRSTDDTKKISEKPQELSNTFQLMNPRYNLTLDEAIKLHNEKQIYCWADKVKDFVVQDSTLVVLYGEVTILLHFGYDVWPLIISNSQYLLCYDDKAGRVVYFNAAGFDGMFFDPPFGAEEQK